ncbi:MAG TPA: hypothetical protein VN577_10095 [Terriglobales bacterium]|nr:hypothetical protein [Terriglobales bacterium]
MNAREIDELEYSEVAALFDYWKETPPAHILVKAFFKMGGEEPESKEITDEQFNELASMFPIKQT